MSEKIVLLIASLLFSFSVTAQTTSNTGKNVKEVEVVEPHKELTLSKQEAYNYKLMQLKNVIEHNKENHKKAIIDYEIAEQRFSNLKKKQQFGPDIYNTLKNNVERTKANVRYYENNLAYLNASLEKMIASSDVNNSEIKEKVKPAVVKPNFKK